MGRVAGAVAHETRSRGVRQILSPVINIANDVRLGRVEETYGEDPYLTSVMGQAFIAPFERAGVIATPKHFIANVGEGGRDSYPIDFNERTLEELFYPPFRDAIDKAGARSIMTAYNSVDGSPATQNRALLNGKLKGDWGFQGFVISDAAAPAARRCCTIPSEHCDGRKGCTRCRPGRRLPVFLAAASAVPRGLSPRAHCGPIIDAAVARAARESSSVFERPYADPDSAAY
jgi:beta-glucosidase